MNKKGVTLIELIVVMVIIGIGAALMAPGIGRWLSNYRLRSATRDIVSTMRTAQMRAISTNLTYQVFFTGTTYVLRYKTTAGTWVNEVTTTTQSLPSGISISANTFPVFSGGKSAQFNTDSTASGGGLTLNGQLGTKTLTVSPITGRCTIKDN
jgi:prepilin-type N-terminal cleavage/methylation domain-containing protein